MRTCDICHGAIVDDDGNTIVDDQEMPLLAHVKCWLEYQSKETQYQSKIAVINTIGELRALIADLPDSMPLIIKLSNKRETNPIVAVEPRKDKSFILEIRG